jgi:LIM domain
MSMGRPLAAGPQQKSYSIRGRKVSPTAAINLPARSSSGEYRESGARWIERQEAISLREALEEMDHHGGEKRIYAEAQDEAADLVWRHRNPKEAEQEKNAAYANPDVQREGRHRSTAHLHKGTDSCGPLVPREEARESIPTLTSFGSSGNHSNCSFDDGSSDHSICSKHAADEQSATNEPLEDSSNQKFAAVETNESMAQSSRQKSSGQRKTSHGSIKGGFPNANDQIYEDLGAVLSQAENATTPSPNTSGPLRSANRNAQLRGSRPLPGHPIGSGLGQNKTLDRFEIHRNPPSQSRSAGYTRNTLPQSIDVIPEVETPPSKNGVEIRGEDIRAATSMRLKDRSPKLPLPTAVSDCPGRPIVSFDTGWKPGDVCDKNSSEAGRPGPRPTATLPALTVSAPVVPTINISGLEKTPVPTITTPDDDLTPAITVSTDEPTSTTVAAQSPARRPLPQPSKTMPGNLPTAKTSSRLSWLNSTSRANVPTATCANCALPISGRIVTASGAGACSSSLKARFHPECFTCHHCSTALECVAFYPEPEDKRLKRLEADGLCVDNEGGELRFYCHLDFHEFFSPRCRSCKTPIEGEVIVAAGGEWHVGHFFCSECGDPFDSNTPFVEKDNYAYCVSCHTRRTSARCKGCKKQILDEMTVQALGVRWHADCFSCYECGGGFGDDGRFFVRDVTVEGTEKERRRGISQKIEERAVCEGCEGRRLKA